MPGYADTVTFGYDKSSQVASGYTIVDVLFHKLHSDKCQRNATANLVISESSHKERTTLKWDELRSLCMGHRLECCPARMYKP